MATNQKSHTDAQNEVTAKVAAHNEAKATKKSPRPLIAPNSPEWARLSPAQKAHEAARARLVELKEQLKKAREEAKSTRVKRAPKAKSGFFTKVEGGLVFNRPVNDDARKALVAFAAIYFKDVNIQGVKAEFDGKPQTTIMLTGDKVSAYAKNMTAAFLYGAEVE